MKKLLNKGFTLVELAIVMVIIALIVGGVLVGRDLIRQAKLKTIVQDIQNFKTAIGTFQLKYILLPGDMNNASSFWFDAVTCPASAAPAGCNGNANGEVASGGESLRAWQHLSLANLIDGSYSGVGAPVGDVNIGVNVPDSSITGGGFSFYHGNTVFGKNGNYLEFGTANGNFTDTGAISVMEAWGIDKKMDNGLADSGNIEADDANCLTGAVFTVGSGYDFTNNGTQSCALIFWYE